MIPVFNKKLDYARIPKGALYVGRPTPLGNPFPIAGRDTREDVIAMYFIWFHLMLDVNDFYWNVCQASQATAFVCWCAPEACHADVIAEYLSTH